MSARTRALEKKAVNEDAKAAKAAADKEREDEAQWAVGAKKGKDDEDKEALKRQKAAEKAALLAQEEAELSGITRVAKPTKKKGKDDLDFLKQALAQQPKTKAQKEAEQKAKADEERKRKEQEARAAKEERRKAEEEEIKRNLAKGIVMNHSDAHFLPNTNRVEKGDFEDVSGIDSALDVLHVGDGKVDNHPEKRMKALYNAYYESMYPVLKEENPHLKLSQYKERIFEMWKKAPENPKNQVQHNI